MSTTLTGPGWKSAALGLVAEAATVELWGEDSAALRAVVSGPTPLAGPWKVTVEDDRVRIEHPDVVFRARRSPERPIHATGWQLLNGAGEVLMRFEADPPALFRTGGDEATAIIDFGFFL